MAKTIPWDAKRLFHTAFTYAMASLMKVSTLIESLPGYGKAKAAKIMEELGISATRRVQGLGVRQREQLLEQLTK